jgi:hypothetical protein
MTLSLYIKNNLNIFNEDLEKDKNILRIFYKNDEILKELLKALKDPLDYKNNYQNNFESILEKNKDKNKKISLSKCKKYFVENFK